MYKDRTPWCQHCKSKKDLHINSRRKSGEVSYMCRACTTEHARKYRKTKNGKMRIYSAVYKSIRKHQEKQGARVILNLHVKKGLIIRPKRCSKCKKLKKVEAHHEDYSKPLIVKWLCRQCHANIHRTDVAK